VSEETKQRATPVHRKWSITVYDPVRDDLHTVNKDAIDNLQEAQKICRQLAADEPDLHYTPTKFGPTYTGIKETVSRVKVLG
jgi:hypothetical protein